MCGTCGCSDAPGEGGSHAHEHDHGHSHETGRGRFVFASRGRARVKIERNVLEKNDQGATTNRLWLRKRRIVAINVVSAPGAGKTTLLERTIRDRGAQLGISVIEGDQATDNDAARIRAAGARAIQINTGAGCHLDAPMVLGALEELFPAEGSTVLIENVGNLVCPALFDLGEAARVVVASVTEGDDKPIKYPHMFRSSDVMVLNKIDLAPYVTFDVDRCIAHARSLNPRIRVFTVSATRGDGLDAWYDWLDSQRSASATTTDQAHDTRVSP